MVEVFCNNCHNETFYIEKENDSLTFICTKCEMDMSVKVKIKFEVE